MYGGTTIDYLSNPNPNIYNTGSYLVLDFETSSIGFGSALELKNNLVLACWYQSWDDSWHSKFGEEFEQQALVKAVARADFIVAQNAKFELGWLDRCGVDIHDVLVWDTMLAEWVVLGNRKLPKDLSSIAKRRGLPGKEDVVGGMIKLGIDCNSIPQGLLETYCFQDVCTTLEVFESQLEELTESKQLHLVYSRCLLTPVLFDIEKQGVTLDKEAVYKEYEAVLQEQADTEACLKEFATINFNSKQQVAALLYDQLGFSEAKDRKGKTITTPGGARSASASTISSLRATTAVQRDFLSTYSKLAKLNTKLSKTLNFFKEICDNHGGTFHGAFNQGSTGTHRLSSSGRPVVSEEGEAYSAQLQNMPREYKKLVRALRDGWEVVEADGSQIEFRVAADLGHDDIAYEEIANDADIHANTAKALTDAGEPSTRQDAKSRTFRPLYGGTTGSPAEVAYCKFFQDKYKGIYKTQTAWTHEVLKSGKLVTPYGLVFYWPGTKMGRSGFIDNTTSIFNYPIQGFATAEIVPIVLISLWHRLRTWNVRIVLTVHDSIIIEVAPDVDKEELKKIIAHAFTTDVYNFLEQCYGYKFRVPLGAEIKFGERWGQGKGEKVKCFPDNREELIWQ